MNAYPFIDETFLHKNNYPLENQETDRYINMEQMATHQDNMSYRYFAFISYSSKDIQYAEELQEFLEGFKLPTIIREEYNLPETLTPIYRDVTDIQIAELQKILRQELERSRFLIIICSPNSAVSPWVNREAEYFIELGRYNNIIPYIISGVPGGGKNECFPGILRNPPEYWPNPHLDLKKDADRVANQRIQNNLKAELADKEQLNGVSLDKEGPAYAHFRVLAKMLGLEPRVLLEMDEVVAEIQADRAKRAAEKAEKQRRFWNRVWASAVCSIAALFLTVLALYFSRDTVEKEVIKEVLPPPLPVITKYYADYVERWGVPEGIFELTEEQVKHRDMSWRITSKGGIVEELACVDCYKRLREPNSSEYQDRCALKRYSYSTEHTKRFPSSKIYDMDRTLLLREVCIPIQKNSCIVRMIPCGDNLSIAESQEEKADMDEKSDNSADPSSMDSMPETAMVSPLDVFSEEKLIVRKKKKRGAVESSVLKSNVNGYIVTYRPDGRELGRMYQNGGNLACGEDKTFGRQYSQYDSMGRVLTLVCLGNDGKPMVSQWGYSHKCYAYSDESEKFGGIKNVTYQNLDGKYTLGEFKYGKVERNFDAFGNVTEERYYNFDENGQWVLSKENSLGAAISRTEYYSIYAVPIRTFFLDSEEKPCLNQEGIAGWESKFDELNNEVSRTFLGIDQKPCLSKEGIAGWQSCFDTRHNEVSRAFLGIDQKPCLNKEGIAKWTVKYDKYDNLTERTNWNIDGKLSSVSGLKPYDKYEITYKNNVKESQTWFFSIKPYNGVLGKYVEHYNSREKVVSAEYFDSDGKPCACEDGFAGWKSQYDGKGNETRREFFGIADESVPRNGDDPYDGWEKTYDENGKLLTYTWFYHFKSYRGVLGKYVHTYNVKGQLIKAEYFDLDGKPCLNTNCIAGWAAKYDERGNRIETAYFGVDGNPCLNNNGYAGRKDSFDEKKNIIKRAYFGVDGKPCLNTNCIAGWKDTFDEKGNSTETAYFGVDGNPCMSKEGLARFTNVYDDRGNLTLREFFGVDGKPCLHKDGNAIVRWKYDDRGNITEQAYFDVDGQPCLNKSGIAGWKDSFDEKKNIIKRAYFGMDDQPCLHKDGNAGWEAKYDEQGNKTEQVYFGVDGKPCKSKDGYARWTGKYDERGNQIETAYFGLDGKPCISRFGCVTWTAQYDERGNKTEEAYFGLDNKLCVNNEGIAKWTAIVDRQGNQLDTTYFGVDGKPCKNNKGNARWTGKYDDWGNKTEEAYFGLDDKPCVNFEGIAKWTAIVDRQGNRLDTSFFDVNGKPCKSKDGYARWTGKYDERGNQIEGAYFGLDGKSCLNKDAYARWTGKYDERGNQIEGAYFGLDGMPCVFGGDDPYTSWAKKFDENGKRTQTTWFYTIKPYKGILGSWIQYYDSNGNIVQVHFLDKDGKPCLCNDGYAKRTVDYDANGNQIRVHLFDVEGNELSGVIIVNSILSDSQAEKLGLKEGDIFLEYDGKFFGDFSEFINYRKAETGENPRTLIVLRGEEFLTFDVVPGQISAGLGVRCVPMSTVEQIKSEVQKYKESRKKTQIQE